MEVVLAMAAEEVMVVEEDQDMETQVVDMEVEEEDMMVTMKEEILVVVRFQLLIPHPWLLGFISQYLK